MTRIAAHRGGTLEYGDSTPAGFRATARLPLEEVEFDLHPTRDGDIVVHHDPTLDRTTDRTGAIADLTAAEVTAATIHYGQGGHPLTLAQFCTIFAGSPVTFRCEIKAGQGGRPYRDFVPRVVEALAAQKRLDGTVFSSFQIDTLAEVEAACNRPTLWLVSRPVLHQLGRRGVIDAARSRGIAEIGVHVDEADAGLMAQVRGAGIAFGCWAAHSAAQIEKALALGVKVFTTDRPSLAIALRAATRI